jgi:hypothetical protein
MGKFDADGKIYDEKYKGRLSLFTSVLGTIVLEPK